MNIDDQPSIIPTRNIHPPPIAPVITNLSGIPVNNSMTQSQLVQVQHVHNRPTTQSNSMTEIPSVQPETERTRSQSRSKVKNDGQKVVQD